MQDEQNQNEEQEKKYKSYQDLVMQQDPMLEDENDQATNPNDQSTEMNKAEKLDEDLIQEAGVISREGEGEQEIKTQEAIEGVQQIREIQNTQAENPMDDPDLQLEAQKNLDKKQIAAGKLKVIEGIGKMAASRAQELERRKILDEGRKAVKDKAKKETELEGAGALNQIEQEAQRQAQEQLQRQIQIKQIQDQRKKEAEDAEKKRKLKVEKKKAQGKGFLGLIKKEVNPASPGKTLKVIPGLNWITAYFETLLP